jgi:hypothetical protein
MKIGYLLSGHPKTYTECIETFNLNLKDSIDGIYSHMWWDDSYQDKCYKMHFSEKLESYNLSKYLIEKFEIENYQIQKEIKFDITFFNKFSKNAWGNNSEEFYKTITPIVLHGLLSQTYSVYLSYLLSISDDLDVIIRSRPDLILTKKISNIIKSLDFKKNTIFFQSSLDGGHLYAGEFPNNPCDWFFLGKKDSMEIFLKGWHDEIKKIYSEGIIHTNELVKLVCIKNNLEIQIVDFGAYIYKQSTNYYDLYHNKIDVYLNDFDKDKNKPKTPSIWPYWIENVNFSHFKNLEF